MSARAIQVLLGVVLGLILALLATFRYIVPELTPGNGAGASLLIPDPFPAPPLALADPEGRPWTLADARGSVAAVFFGYTHCPDVCPLTLARLGRYQEARGDAFPPLAVVFVSLDPDRDTPDRLREFVSGLPGRVQGVTAAEAEVREQAGAFGVMVVERPDASLPQGEYLVDHTARTFILDPEGRVVATLPPMASPEEISSVLAEVFATLR